MIFLKTMLADDLSVTSQAKSPGALAGAFRRLVNSKLDYRE
jgi:hypothetical protein